MSMPRTAAKTPLAIISFALAFAILCFPHALRAQTIPSDAASTCVVSPTDFANWFESHTPSLNGVVKPADSLNFIDQPNCPFYQWAEQMFLWITSPAPPTYCGGGNHVFDSPAFFDVSPLDQNSQRNFIQHTCGPFGGINRFLLVRAAKVGPHGLPVVFDKKGRMLDIEPAPKGPTGKPIVLDRQGNPVEIESIRLVKGKPVFTAKAGIVRLPRPMLKTRFNRAFTVQQFMIGNRPIFLDPSGNVVETEEGQAVSNAVLMSQTGSLTYYVAIVNDVFAYFLTGAKTGHITPTANQFPTTPADLAQITSFASSHGVTFPDPNALAVELKTSWVEASTLPDASKYITTMATIPTYTKMANQWTPLGQQTVKLALVGMHVVGSTGTQGNPNGPGHPEMIWATFEHFGNLPLDAYNYNSTGGPKTVPQNTAGTWLFSKNNSTGPFNCELLFDDAGSIKPATTAPPCPPGGFVASDSIRRKAWGAASDVSPNPIDGDTTTSNTEIISINNSIHGQMPGGDVRNNYYLAGATWTIFGGAPNAGDQVGTSMLAGGSMETYFQGSDTTAANGGSNCFTCHVSNPNAFGRATTDVSHIFAALTPLIFPHLAVRVTVLQKTLPLHSIRVTATNSATGAPVAGATVTVLDADSGDEKASGTTAADGTVSLKYSRCSIFLNELPNKPPRRVFVPCDGSASAAGLGDATFSAP